MDFQKNLKLVKSLYMKLGEGEGNTNLPWGYVHWPHGSKKSKKTAVI